MIYFLIYLFLEVMVTTDIASRIGGVATFIEIIASAVLGIVILLNFRHTLSENIQALQMRQIDMDGFTQRNLMGLFGAILLILPGFLGDILGLLMQFTLISKLLINRFSRKYQKPNQPKEDYVIDAEIIDDTPTLR
ncbi:FxsA family protein [Sulfuricurvum sp.]|uniref:FxsA family protein n=1 Tax=Sulfuricurvum sp. TaxID=2025608 RepID=UPI0035676763